MLAPGFGVARLRDHTRATRERFSGYDGLISLAIYLAITVFWNRGTLAHITTQCACGVQSDPGDAATVAWSLAWLPHALGSGLSVFYSHAMWSPTGINLAGATTTSFLALLFAPVTLAWGPIVSYNVLAVLAPAAGAWCAQRLCRYLSGSPWASIVAGAVYGFSTYETAQLIGHTQMFFICVPPLAALCALKFIDGVTSRRRFITTMTVLLLVEMFTAPEMLFTMTAVGSVALAAGWLFGTGEYRRTITSKLPTLAVPYLVMLILSSWYIDKLLHANDYAKGSGLFWVTDAFSFVTPMPYTWIFGRVFSPVTSMFHGGLVETDAYIGLPLLLVVLRFLSTHWSERRAKVIASVMAVVIVWILGSNLYAAGVKTIWLPYSLLHNLPVFNEVMEGRIALYLSLICAIVLSLWLARSGRSAALRWVVGLIALAFVLPNLIHPSAFNNGTWTNPTFFRTDMYKRYIRPGQNILPIQWGWNSESPMWQAEDRFYYNIASGDFLFGPLAGWGSDLTNDLWFDSPHLSEDAPLLKTFLADYHVSDIVVEPPQLELWGPMLRKDGFRHPDRVGGILLYHVPDQS